MAIVIISEQTIRTINGEAVTLPELQLARMYDKDCCTLIRLGWVPTAVRPSKEDIEILMMQFAEKRKETPTPVRVKMSDVRLDKVRVDYAADVDEDEEVDEQDATIRQLQSEIDELKRQGY
jgi:hypothetical protein